MVFVEVSCSLPEEAEKYGDDGADNEATARCFIDYDHYKKFLKGWEGADTIEERIETHLREWGPREFFLLSPSQHLPTQGRRI